MAKRYVPGQQFGRLTLVERSPRGGDFKYSGWLCQCSCGTAVRVDSSNLSGGNTKSCGCLRPEACRNRESKKNHPTHGHILSYYKRNAKKANREWSLSEEEFTSLILGDCDYCGAEPEERSQVYWYARDGEPHYRTSSANGIDRLDNDSGYVYANCVSCCSTCNKMKYTASRQSFLEHVERIYRHTQQKESRHE